RKGHSYIVVYDLDGEALRYLAPSSDRDALPRWSPDGREIAFIRQPGREDKRPLIPVQPAPWSIWVADPASGLGRPVWQSSRELAGSLPVFIGESFHFAADHRVVFDSEHERGGRNRLYAVSTAPAGAAGLQPAVPLTPGDYDVEDVTLSADGRSVLF